MSQTFGVKMTVVGMLALLAAGCATVGAGPTEQERLQATLDGWSASFESQDIDAMMAFYSEDFATDAGYSRNAIGQYFQAMADAGYLEGAEADFSLSTIVMQNGTATVGPIYLSSFAGSLRTMLELEQDADGVWRIVESEIRRR